MAVADKAAYLENMKGGGSQIIPFAKTALTTIAGRLYDPWTTATLAGSAPTTAEALSLKTGAVGGISGGEGGWYDGTTKRLVAAQLAATQPGTYYLCDRLSQQGGLSGTGTGVAQTTNLPTAALTRYTDGVGVFAGLTVYTQIGTTAQTITCSYTNEGNTSGRTSTAIAIGGTGFREAGRLFVFPLQAGDTGVRAVASITITGATGTGTAGNLGVTLFKPLYSFHIERIGEQKDFDFITGGLQGGMPQVVNGACLCWIYMPAGTSTALTGSLTFNED